MKKGYTRLLSMLLTLVMVFSMLPAKGIFAVADESGNQILLEENFEDELDPTEWEIGDAWKYDATNHTYSSDPNVNGLSKLIYKGNDKIDPSKWDTYTVYLTVTSPTNAYLGTGHSHNFYVGYDTANADPKNTIDLSCEYSSNKAAWTAYHRYSPNYTLSLLQRKSDTGWGFTGNKYYVTLTYSNTNKTVTTKVDYASNGSNYSSGTISKSLTQATTPGSIGFGSTASNLTIHSIKVVNIGEPIVYDTDVAIKGVEFAGDNNNLYLTRPESIEVSLTSGGELVSGVDPITLTKSSSYAGSFANVPYNSSTAPFDPITYSVVANAEGYTSSFNAETGILTLTKIGTVSDPVEVVNENFSESSALDKWNTSGTESTLSISGEKLTMTYGDSGTNGTTAYYDKNNLKLTDFRLSAKMVLRLANGNNQWIRFLFRGSGSSASSSFGIRFFTNTGGTTTLQYFRGNSYNVLSNPTVSGVDLKKEQEVVITVVDNKINVKVGTYEHTFVDPANTFKSAGAIGFISTAFDPTIDDLVIEDISTYTVNFEGAANGSFTQRAGSTLTVPAGPSKASDDYFSYAFAGWDTDGDEIADLMAGTNYTVTKNVTATPLYTPTTIAKDLVINGVTFEDNDDLYLARPGSITVTLLDDGVATDKTLILNAANNYANTFTALPLDGSVYSLQVQINDYIATYEEATGIITLKHTGSYREIVNENFDTEGMTVEPDWDRQFNSTGGNWQIVEGKLTHVHSTSDTGDTVVPVFYKDASIGLKDFRLSATMTLGADEGDSDSKKVFSRVKLHFRSQATNSSTGYAIEFLRTGTNTAQQVNLLRDGVKVAGTTVNRKYLRNEQQLTVTVVGNKVSVTIVSSLMSDPVTVVLEDTSSEAILTGGTIGFETYIDKASVDNVVIRDISKYSLDLNGTNVNVQAGQQYTIPDAANMTGNDKSYSYAGWDTDGDGNIDLESGDTLNITKDVTLGQPVYSNFKGSTHSLNLNDVIYLNRQISIDTSKYSTVSGGLLWWTDSSIENATVGTEGVNTHAFAIAGSLLDNNRILGVNADDYGKTVYMRYYVSDGNGGYDYSAVYSDSVLAYCQDAFDRGSDNTKQLAAAVLAYGAEAQKYFGTDTGNLVDTVVPEDLKIDLTTDWNSDLLTPVTEFTGTAPGNADESFTKITHSLSLVEAVRINYYFQCDLSNIQSAQLLIWNGAQWVDSGATVTTSRKNGVLRYFAQSPELNAKDMGKTVYVCMALTDENDTVHYSPVDAYSPIAYASALLELDSQSSVHDLVKYMVIYGERAKTLNNA